MEMLERYLASVAQKLPQKMRGDVAAEIRSTLEDMLEDRSLKTGAPPDEAMLTEALREYGSPARVAATYLPARYLVGPQLYPVFSLVLKIVLTILTILALVGLGIGIASNPENLTSIIQSFGRALANYYEIMIAAFGNIVLVFAILQRLLPASEFAEPGQPDATWDPAELMRPPSTDEVKLWEPIVAILFGFIALVIFNFYPQILRYTPSLNEYSAGRVILLPLFSPEFFRYLPWLNILWILGIVQNIFLLRARRWTPSQRIANIALKLLGIGVLVAMLSGPALLDTSAEALAAWQMKDEAIETLMKLLNTILRFALGIGIFGSVVEIIKELYKLIARPTQLKPAL